MGLRCDVVSCRVCDDLVYADVTGWCKRGKRRRRRQSRLIYTAPFVRVPEAKETPSRRKDDRPLEAAASIGGWSPNDVELCWCVSCAGVRRARLTTRTAVHNGLKAKLAILDVKPNFLEFLYIYM